MKEDGLVNSLLKVAKELEKATYIKSKFYILNKNKFKTKK